MRGLGIGFEIYEDASIALTAHTDVLPRRRVGFIKAKWKYHSASAKFFHAHSMPSF